MSIGLLIDVGKSLTSFDNGLISIDLDVTMDEAHEWTNDVTTSPVEIGSPISDHIQEMPDRLTITGMISDAAISESILSQLQTASSGGIDSSSYITRVQTTFDLLRAMIKWKRLVTVYTRYKIYPDMALSSINIPRSAGIGEAINFTAQFVNVRLVESQTVDVPPGISKKADAKAGGAGGATAKKTQVQKKGGAVQASPVEKPKGVLAGILGL